MAMEPAGGRGSLLRLFSNPAIGIIGSIASIAGLLLAVYFYRAGLQTRDLRYFVHPAKAVVVKAGQSSRLRITLDGAPVERDVTAAQVAFWNEGGDAIRQEHMLRPLVIRTSPHAPILEARLRKVRRDVSNIVLDLGKLSEGEVRLSWTILERYDGGVLQLIYLGDADTHISATASVERQGDVRALTFGGDAEQYLRHGGSQRAIGYAYLAMGMLMGVVGVYRIRYRRRIGISLPMFLRVAYIGAPIVIGAMALYLIFWLAVRPGPPFGFE